MSFLVNAAGLIFLYQTFFIQFSFRDLLGLGSAAGLLALL